MMYFLYRLFLGFAFMKIYIYLIYTHIFFIVNASDMSNGNIKIGKRLVNLNVINMIYENDFS